MKNSIPMKNLLLLFTLHILSTGLWAQTRIDSTYTNTDLILKTSTGDIYGTLTLPNQLKPSPVVLIIAGSGPTDRDGNSAIGLNTNAYRMLSESFGKHGIATLRFDKRGIGQSKPALMSENDIRFESYIQDVEGWIDLLKSDRRFSKIILLGHSEGSLIGLVAAEQGYVAGMISVAGAGKPIDIILKDQLKSKLTPKMMDETNHILDSLKNGKTVSDIDPYLLMLFRPSVQPYLISWLKYDPAKDISVLHIPVLIIQGTTDIQVSTDDANMLSNANPAAQLSIIPNMNHVLKNDDGNPQNQLASYNNPDLPLNNEFVYEVVKFIRNTIGLD